MTSGLNESLHESLNEKGTGLEARLRARLMGNNVEFHESIASTQRRAHELARESVNLAVVAAGEQTEGRGRAARRWESPKGCGLYFSVLFRPALPPSSVYLTNVAAALAVAGAVESLLGITLSLKWPNDLLLPSGLKVCGILSESATRGGVLDYCVTGIGLNLCEPSEPLPPETAGRAGWLCPRVGLDGAEPDRVELLARVAESFFGWVALMEREGSDSLLEKYREKCASIGKVVAVETDGETFTGLCVGVGSEGELLLETTAETRRFHAADITHARAQGY